MCHDIARIPTERKDDEMIVLRQDADVSSVDGCTVLTMEAGDLAVLNGTASLMLEELLQGTPHDEIATKVSNLFDVDSPTVERDLASFIEEMDGHSLLGHARSENGR